MKLWKRTSIRRALSGLVCLTLCLSFLPTGAGAEENGEAPKITVTQEVTSDEAAGTTTTVTTTVTQGEGFRETVENTVVTDDRGNVIRESGCKEGSETRTEEKTGDVPELSLEFTDLIPGETASDTGEAAEPTLSGDIRTGEDDPEYDETVISETPRELTGTLTGTEVTLGDGDVEYGEGIGIGVESLDPSWPERGAEENLNVHEGSRFAPDGEAPEGYDYYYSAYTGDSTYGVKVLDENGNVLEYCDVVQFELTSSSTGVKHTAYCADLNTGTENGWWYTMENVEDANYVSEADAAHIKAIAANGYWGTAEGTGSLTQMKQMLKAALDQDPEALGGLTGEDIDGLTAGEAQTATQMAIWMFGNHYTDRNVTFTASNCNNSGDGSADVDPSGEDLAAWNRINQISAYLSGLPAGETENLIFSADTFLSSVGITVGGRVEGHENNADTDDTNDAYHVDLTFALEVTVDENDDLIVKVLDGSGTVLRTVRLAGDDTGTGYGTILPDENGTYTIAGLTLVEREAAFNITLEGAQHLEQGVYIYTSEVRGGESSQTFVGIAEGYQTVDLSMEVEFDFRVEEGTVTTQRVWRSEWDQELTQEEETTEPTTEETTETMNATVEEAPSPETGEEAWAVQWMLMLFFSAMALIAAVIGLKRKV